MGRSAPIDHWMAERQALMQIATQNGAVSAALYVHPESGVVVAFWGRLDNRAELSQALGSLPGSGDDALVAEAWLRWGERCPERLIGDFAFAVASPRAGTVFLARDVMGVKPLYYRADADGVFFANSVAAFSPLQIGTLTPSRRWVASYLLEVSQSHDETAYEEIRKLPGAHSLLIHADGRTSLRRYHRFIDDAPDERRRDSRWLDSYQAVWQEAVACRLPRNGPVACENSGGLDSGSITAEVARQLGGDVNRLHAMGFCREALEPEHIMATAMRWKLKHNALFSHDGSLESDGRRSLAINGYPQEHSNGASHSPFYELCAQNGIGTLLSGFGGDEAVTYPGGVPARLERLDKRDWLGLLRILPGPLPMRLGRLAKTLRTGMKLPQHHAGLMASWKARWPYHFLSRAALSEFGLESRYFDAATYDERFRTINDAVLYLLSRPFAPTRLENCSLMAAASGIEYAWPMLDQRLLQQWLSTPSVWKVGDGGMSRFLHRRAVAGTCPDIVAWKRGKDMGFAAGEARMAAADNRPLFHQALQLTESVPHLLESVLDVAKVRKMAEQGIREDWRGVEVQVAWGANVDQLSNLLIWLRQQA